VRSDAAETLAYFREQGVTLRVISGDSPLTVAAVARKAGLEFDGNGFDARELPTDIDELAAVLEREHVFGRVTPHQKKDMVLALQHAGHVVAMTGDGVNDALALKYADIGIAMGSGAAATRAVSRMVLLDGRFSDLPRVVAEGRRVIANVERLSKLFLSKTVYAILFAVTFGLLLWQFPLLPRQFSAVDGLTIGLPALVLALLPNTRRYVPGFLTRALRYCVPSGLVVGFTVIAVVAYTRLSGIYSERDLQAATVITLALSALWVLNILMRPFSLWRIGLLVAMYLGLIAVLTAPLVSDFLGLALPPTPLVLVCIAAASIACLLLEVLHFALTRKASAPPA
jgi:cation-transporting ATPase E